MLPKITKTVTLSDSSYPTVVPQELSELIETILKPPISQKASFLQDIMNFLNKIKNINHLPRKVIFAIVDATRLY